VRLARTARRGTGDQDEFVARLKLDHLPRGKAQPGGLPARDYETTEPAQEPRASVVLRRAQFDLGTNRIGDTPHLDLSSGRKCELGAAIVWAQGHLIGNSPYMDLRIFVPQLGGLPLNCGPWACQHTRKIGVDFVPINFDGDQCGRQDRRPASTAQVGSRRSSGDASGTSKLEGQENESRLITGR
jgi:hypothetical protein